MARSLPSESWSSMCERVEQAKGSVAWRWAATRSGGGEWSLVALVVNVGESASQCLDRYEHVIVAVEELSPQIAADRLREGKVSADDRDAAGLSFPIQQNVVPQRVYSSEAWAFTETGWPRLVVDVRATSGGGYVESGDPLQAPGMPFYPSLGAAIAEKVFCVPPAHVRLGQHAQVLVRITDRRGRISKVEASADGVHLTVEEGEQTGLEGFTLRAAWRKDPDSREWERRNYELQRLERIDLGTGGVPAELAVILVDLEGDEIDARSWDEQLSRSIEEPVSFEGLVARWLSEGEYQQLEYKQTLKEEKTRVSFAETVAAFANGSGGTVLLGVDDQGVVVGYGPPKAKDQVTNIIAGLVDERPDFEVLELKVDDKPIVIVRVASSAPYHRPHQVRGRAMVRALATTRQASPLEVREMTVGAEDINPWQVR